MKKILVTGAGGLIGSEVVNYFSNKGNLVIGLDNNMRAFTFTAKIALVLIRANAFANHELMSPFHSCNENLRHIIQQKA